MKPERYKGVDILIGESGDKYVFRFVESTGGSSADVTFTPQNESDSEEEALKKAKVVIDARDRRK